MTTNRRTGFAPFRPGPLRRAVDRAEEVVRELDRATTELRHCAPTGPRDLSEREVWLMGRAEELETFVSDVLTDWRRGVLVTDDAALIVSRYVEQVHRGMAARLAVREPLPRWSLEEHLTRESFSVTEWEACAVTLTARAR
jgi:hypothetical protein